MLPAIQFWGPNSVLSLHDVLTVYTRHTRAPVPSDVSRTRDFRKRLIVNTFMFSTYIYASATRMLAFLQQSQSQSHSEVSEVHLIHKRKGQLFIYIYIYLYGTRTQSLTPLSLLLPCAPYDLENVEKNA